MELKRKQLLQAMGWLDDPKRTKEEIEKWFPKYKQLFGEMTGLEREERNVDLSTIGGGYRGLSIPHRR